MIFISTILVLDLKKTIGSEPRGYPNSFLDVFRDPEVVLEYEKFEEAMDTDGNGIIGESEFNSFKDYSKTSDELFNNGHEDTWLLTLKSPKGRGEYNVENLKLIRHHQKIAKLIQRGKNICLFFNNTQLYTLLRSILPKTMSGNMTFSTLFSILP